MNETIALVTGANKGIGKEIARGLAEHGYTVLLGARDQARGDAAAAELAAAGEVRVQQLDVTDPASITAAAKRIEQEFGRLDVLVNNAGIAGLDDGTGAALMRDIYQVNVFGLVDVTEAMLPLLRASDSGRIVNVSSTMGSLAFMAQHVPGVPVSLAYPSSKTAVNAITAQYARLLADTPIKVNAICPGYCATDLNNHRGAHTPAQGAIPAIRMCTVADGTSGTFVDENGVVAW